MFKKASPTQQEIRDARAISGLSQAGAAALIYSTLGFSENPKIEIVDLLLKSGANPNVVTKYTNEYNRCNTVLTIAAQYAPIEFTQLLILNKADVNLTCENGDAPLVHAVQGGRIEAVKLLLEARANAKSGQGQRALQFAKEKLKEEKDRNIFEEIIKLLDAAGVK